MTVVESFAPVIGTDPKVLILGSMPGVKSLQHQQYYAHPRNAFWPIMGELLQQQWAEDYALRIAQFEQQPLALWDVLRHCEREGSLDSAIRSEQPNALVELLDELPNIRLIAFNGGAADRLFRKHFSQLAAISGGFELIRLPSTSPAYAGMRFEQKLEAWSVIRGFCT